MLQPLQPGLVPTSSPPTKQAAQATCAASVAVVGAESVRPPSPSAATAEGPTGELHEPNFAAALIPVTLEPSRGNRDRIASFAELAWVSTSTAISAVGDRFADMSRSLMENDVRVWASGCMRAAEDIASVACETMRTRLKQLSTKAEGFATAMNSKGIALGHTMKETAGERRVQVAAASAMGGAVVLGATGGAAGLLTGSTIGGTLGLLAAPLTLGLSVPIGIAAGGGTGSALGSAAGGTAGFFAGGAAGYGAYSKKDDIKSGATQALAAAGTCAEHMRDKATISAEMARATAISSAGYVRSKIMGGKGGTT